MTSSESESTSDPLASRRDYITVAVPQMSPARLGAVARLFGLRPAGPDRCRVLELGCGQGFTLLALAQLYPSSEFYGIDLSPSHIDNAQTVALDAGLKNVRFERRDLSDVSLSTDGLFDYVLVHGVYSWVAQPTRSKILEIAARQLSSDGIAYISYNALPGWGYLSVIREMLLYHTASIADHPAKLEHSKRLIRILREIPTCEPWLSKWLSVVGRMLEQADADYFIHDHLAETNVPFFFHEFIASASSAGLKYLAESRVAHMFPLDLGPRLAEEIGRMTVSPIAAEQYMDFARNTSFRASLLCRQGRVTSHRISREALSGIVIKSYVATMLPGMDLRPEVSADFTLGRGARLSSGDPYVKSCLYFLARCRGEYLDLQSIDAGARELLRSSCVPIGADPGGKVAALAERLVALGSEISLPELGAFLPCFELEERPFAVPVARSQARAGRPVLRNDLGLEVLPTAMAKLLCRCDGTLSIEELACGYRAEALDARGLSFEAALDSLVRKGLFWRESVGSNSECVAPRVQDHAQLDTPELPSGPRRIVEAVGRFQLDGAVVLEQVFTPTLVEDLANAFDKYLDGQNHAPWMTTLVGSRRTMFTVQMEPPFSNPAVYGNPLVMSVVRALLGENFVLDSFGAVCAFPGAEQQHVHQDHRNLFEGQFSVVNLPPHAVTLVVPLMDLDSESGTTAIWPGSHIRPDVRQLELSLNQRIDLSSAMLPTTRTGDCYLMDYRVVHAGTPNRSRRARTILYVTYARAWFRDTDNYAKQVPIWIDEAELSRVPDEHRSLFRLVVPTASTLQPGRP